MQITYNLLSTTDSLVYIEGSSLMINSFNSVQKCKIYKKSLVYVNDNNINVQPFFITSISKRNEMGRLFYTLQNVFKSARLGFKNGIRLLGRGYKIFKYLNNYSMRIGFCHQVNYIIPYEMKALSKPKLKNFWFVLGFDKNQISNLMHYFQTFKVPNAYRHKGIYVYDQVYKIKPVKKSL